MKYRLAIFDFDGTLGSSLEGIHECMSSTLIAYGYPAPTPEAVRSTLSLTLEESIRTLTGGRAPEEQIAAIAQLYSGLFQKKATERVALFDGARRLLEAVSEQGTKLVVVSNEGRAALEKVLDRLKIWFVLDLVLSADDVKYNKPAPELYTIHIAPRFSEIAAKETLVIGDTEADIQFAKAAKVASCWASYGYGDPAKCRALKPNYEIGRITDLIGVLQGKRG
jgi:phosphoglycolate phosphatase